MKALNILLVEDIEIVQLTTQLMLESLGHQVDVASDGVEAIQLGITHPYDAIVMDFQLPRISGLFAARIISSFHRTDEFPPVILGHSSELSEETMKLARITGIREFLPKPASREDFRRAFATLSEEFTSGRRLESRSFQIAPSDDRSFIS